jgi:hypothetical protein
MKPPAFFDPYSQTEGEYRRHTALWKAVILQAFIDMRSNIRRPETECCRKRAVQWMNMDNQNFLDACDRAEINPRTACGCREKILKNLKFNRK